MAPCKAPEKEANSSIPFSLFLEAYSFMVCSVCSARRRVLLVRRSLQKQENKDGTHRLTTDASRFLFYPVFPRILNNSWQVLPLRPQCFWAILLSQYRRRTGSGPCTRGRRLRPPKGDFVTKYLFQFARILAFCFLGEILHAVLPLPIPASVYGLILLLLALRLGIVKLEQVKEVGLFLTGIFPLLFVPAAAGVMELWAEMGSMLLPIIIAIVPVTVLVLASAGRTTQALTSRRKNKEAAHD